MRPIAVGQPAALLAKIITGVTAISCAITASRASGTLPAVVQVSVGGGISTTGGVSAKAYGNVEVSWDFGDSADTRTVTDEFGRTIILNSGQIGPEAAYSYTRPGVYTITCTARIFNGTSVVSSVTTTTYTANDYPSTHQRMYIDTAGNDTNDGKDPNGFALSGATFTNATKTLTKVGAFSGYTHATAISYAYPHARTNWIYIASGTGVTAGWYEIASKVSADAITLVADIGGTNPTNVTSSNGPKATYSGAAGTAGKTFLETASANYYYLFVKGGQSHTITAGISGQFANRRILHYGSNSQFTITPDVTFTGHSSWIQGTNISSGGVNYSDYAKIGILANANSINNDAGEFESDSAIGTVTDRHWEFCTYNNFVGATGVLVVTYTNSLANIKRYSYFKCVFNSTGLPTSHMYVAGTQFFTLLGCTFTGGNGDATFDHFCYPNNWSNRWCAYNVFNTATSLGYALNHNCSDGSGVVTSYCATMHNIFGGPNFGVDFSNSDNLTDGGDFDEFCISDSKFLNMPKESIYAAGGNVKKLYIGRNRFYTTATTSCVFMRIDANSKALNIDMWDNDGQQTADAGEGGLFQINPITTRAGTVINNRMVQLGLGYGWADRDDHIGIAYSGNRVYNPSGTVWLNKNGNVDSNLSDWQLIDGSHDPDLVTTAPGFSAPTSAYFKGGILALENLSTSAGLIQSLDAGTVTSGATIHVGDVYTFTCYLVSVGDKLVVRTGNTFGVTGDGTLNINNVPSASDVNLYPGAYEPLVVDLDTSTAGSKSVVFSAAHDATGSPFTTTFNFTVQASGGGGGTGSLTSLMLLEMMMQGSNEAA